MKIDRELRVEPEFRGRAKGGFELEDHLGGDRGSAVDDDLRLTVVRGDVLDPGSLDAAMWGQDAGLCALGRPAT